MNAIKQLAQVLLIMCLSLGCTSKKANKDPLPDHTFPDFATFLLNKNAETDYQLLTAKLG